MILSSITIFAALAGAQEVLPSRFEIRTILGKPDRGNGGPATNAVLDAPFGITGDAEGNIYIAESGAGLIRKIRAADGVIERFAGGGESAGDWSGQSALETNLHTPTMLLRTPDGKGLLFVDSTTCRIRIVREDGVVDDVAGSGRCSGSSSGGFGGGGGSLRDRPALETDLGAIGGLVYDGHARLVFTEPDRHLVRYIAADGYVRTLAGIGVAGSSGDGAEATSATLNTPRGLAVDNAGVLYLADSYNCKVRKITADGFISVAAGATTCATSTATYNGGSRTPIDRPGALAYDSVSNLLYITMPRVYRVLRFDMNAARITPFLGNGRAGVTETTVPTSLTLNEPSSLYVGLDGALFVTAIDSFQAYQVKDGKVTSVAGRWPQPSEYPAPEETVLMRPQGLLLPQDPASQLLLADSGAGRILRLDQSEFSIVPVAGLNYPSGFDRGTAGPALEATLREPVRMIFGPEGDLYFSERTRIRAINQDGIVRTILDSLDQPFGLAFDGEGRLWFSEAGTHRVLRLDTGSKTPTVMAGTEDTPGFFGDDGVATSALLNSPGDILFDASGNLLIADRGNYRVRLISPEGKIRTIAGSGLTFNYSNMTGHPATETGFGVIEGIALGADGSLYISEQWRIDRIATDGKVEILTGLLSEADNGMRTYLDGPLAGTGAIAVGADGVLYVSMRQDGRVIAVKPKPLE